MAKVAYNGCYGGFGLSTEALNLAREISGNPEWSQDEVERHDPVLIEVIEKLGSNANGASADLQLEELSSGTKYFISEYDGIENVETADSMQWVIAP